MSINDRGLAHRIGRGLDEFESKTHGLPGVAETRRRLVFIEQIVESVHRVEYFSLIRGRPISADRANPLSPLFDPIKAALLVERKGNIEEAFWLAFLSVHFGKNSRTGWRLAADVYAGDGVRWTWKRVSGDPKAFRRWLAANEHALRVGKFGNHRKYVSLSASSNAGTGAAVETYVDWVMLHGSHRALISDALTRHDSKPREAFDYLYESMSVVAAFARMGKFDYLTMISKLGLAPIEPGSTYMQGSTGPKAGAKILFGPQYAPRKLDELAVLLGDTLQVGMQVVEDSICNWQKSPDKFISFRG